VNAVFARSRRHDRAGLILGSIALRHRDEDRVPEAAPAVAA
jgi:hypothetical protein